MRYPSDMVTAIHEARMVEACEEAAARRIRRQAPRLAATIRFAEEV